MNPKKKKPSSIPDDPVSRKALQARIKELREKHFAPWTPSPAETALFEIAEGLEATANGFRALAASGALAGRLGSFRRERKLVILTGLGE